MTGLVMTTEIEVDRTGKAGIIDSTETTGKGTIGTIGTTETGIMKGTRKGENTANIVTMAGSHAITPGSKGTMVMSSLQGTHTGAILPNTVNLDVRRQRLHVSLPAGELHRPTITTGRL